MTKLVWDQTGTRTYETGVDRGVLYIPDSQGAYVNGVAWNGLTTVTEAPSGAESNPQYADNIKYLNLVSAEEFGATIEAFTYPTEFGQFDGIATPAVGLSVAQQSRKSFGLSYRTRFGNDVDGDDYAYKLHLVYNAQAAPSEKAYATVNDSPEAITFSWELTTTPLPIEGMKPSALLTLDSSLADATALANLENILYGSAGTDPRLPFPDEVISLFSGVVSSVTPTVPTFANNKITIPTVTGVSYYINGKKVSGQVTITENTIVTARPDAGYVLAPNVDDDWLYTFA